MPRNLSRGKGTHKGRPEPGAMLYRSNLLRERQTFDEHKHLPNSRSKLSFERKGINELFQAKDSFWVTEIEFDKTGRLFLYVPGKPTIRKIIIDFSYAHKTSWIRASSPPVKHLSEYSAI